MSNNGYEVGTWDLSELFESFDSPQVDAALAQVESSVTEFESFRDELTDDIGSDRLVEMIDHYEALKRLLSRLAGYAGLRFAEDTQNQKAQTFQAKMQQQMAEIENRTLFFKLWWKALPDEMAEPHLQASGDYRYWLEALRLQRPYTLTEPEEQIVNLKDVNGPSALITLYSSITNRYAFQLEVEGELREHTREELSKYIWGPDPDMRARAYQVLHEVYGEQAPILGQIYQFVVRDWRSEMVQVRGYSSPIAVRNLANDIPDDVVDTLLEVCRQNAGLFQEYFELKARWLGMDKLRRFDVYAPVSEADVQFSYGQAVEEVLAAYRQFDADVAGMAQLVLEQGHVDSEVRKGKRAGAFCATIVPDLTPYILTSYDGAARDVATLAHELGHAVHSMLASDHSELTQGASLPLAETASTFGEMLLVDRLLAGNTDPAVKRDLLFRQLDNNYAVIMRQAYFALFEREAHDAIHEGASVDELSDLYLANLQDQFGTAVDLDDGFRHEWVSIPHFYFSPFYVYAYAFGQLLVLSLYQRYLEEGEAFKPGYLDLLSAGGSAAPMDIMKRAGLQVREPAFWQGGFDYLRQILKDLQALEIPGGG